MQNNGNLLRVIVKPSGNKARIVKNPPPQKKTPKKREFIERETSEESKMSQETNAEPIRSLKEDHLFLQYNRELYQRICKEVSATKPCAKYKKLTKIASGATAKVYKGIEVGTGRKVAIKIMNIWPCAVGELMKDRLYREITILKRCSHKNIIEYLDSYIFGNE